MKFSIVVPVYNTEKYLHRCIDSLINQSYKDIEVILVDDGSTDQSPEICDKYASEDSRICVIHKMNGGLSDARNTGVTNSKGDYIIFVDSDDYIENDSCERLLPFARKQYQILVCDAKVEGGELSIQHINYFDEVTGKEFLLRSYKDNKAPMAAVLNAFNRTFLINNELRFKHGILHEDEEFTPRVFLLADRVIYTSIPFYHYVLRDNSITTKVDKRKNAEDLFSTLFELELLYKKLNETELRKYLLNSLADKYLGMFQKAHLYLYAKKYVHKDFVRRNAKLKKTKVKKIVFCCSPKLYCVVYSMLMKISRRQND